MNRRDNRQKNRKIEELQEEKDRWQKECVKAQILLERFEEESKTDMRVADITVGPRHRKELGDIKGLTASIRALGLLQPLVITRKGQLIAGRRRLEAVRNLGWERVPVRVVSGMDDALKLLKAERDENTCRKDFTPSEAVDLGRAIEELEKPKAKERQAQAGPKQGRGAKKGNGSGKFPEPVVPDIADVSRGETRERVAEAVGMSSRTYDKAKAVVQAAEEAPEQFAAVKEEMDKTGKVDPAYKKVRAKKVPAPKPKAGESSQHEPAKLEAAKKAYLLLNDHDKTLFRDWIKHQR